MCEEAPAFENFHYLYTIDGAKEHYSLENNAARSESVEEAVALDRRLLHVWNGHPYHVVIDNSFETFEEKMHALELSLAKLLSIMPPGIPNGRFLTFKLEKSPSLLMPSNEIEIVDESQVNLEIDNMLLSQVHMEFPMLKEWDVASISLVCRKQDNNCSYWMKLKLSGNESESDVLKRLPLSSYQNFITHSRINVSPVISTATHFVINHTTFTLRETLGTGTNANAIHIQVFHCGSPSSRNPTASNKNKFEDSDLPDFIKECGISPSY